MKRVLILLFALFFSLFARSLEEIQDDGKIIVAVYENFPPYSYMEKGEAKGVDIEIAKEIAKRLGVEVSWYWTGSDESLDDDLRNIIWKGNLVHKTKADLMFRVPYDYDFIRETDKSTGELNNEMVIMKSPYHAESWVIATKKDTISEINSLAIFQYHSVAVEIDTLPDAFLTSSFRGALKSNVKHYLNIKDAIEDLKGGKVDAVAGLKSQLEYYLDYKNSNNRYFISRNIDFMKSKWDIGLAVRTDFRVLSYKLDALISEFYGSGLLKNIFEKYNLTYEKPLSR